MLVKQCHRPPIWIDALYHPFIVQLGMVYCCFTNITVSKFFGCLVRLTNMDWKMVSHGMSEVVLICPGTNQAAIVRGHPQHRFQLVQMLYLRTDTPE